MAKKVPGHDFSFRNDKSSLCYASLREQAAVCSLFCSDNKAIFLGPEHVVLSETR
jgi:hypothetical protein